MLIVAGQSNLAFAFIWPNPGTSNAFLNAFAQPLPDVGGNNDNGVHRSVVGRRAVSPQHEKRLHRSFSMPFDTDDTSSTRLQTVADMAVHDSRKSLMNNSALDTRSATSLFARIHALPNQYDAGKCR
jgi:hypothetical protein